jgi:hypothetical protein
MAQALRSFPITGFKSSVSSDKRNLELKISGSFETYTTCRQLRFFEHYFDVETQPQLQYVRKCPDFS